MTRTKGTPNKKVATVKYETESGLREEGITESDLIPLKIHLEKIIPGSPNASHHINQYYENALATKEILLSIVDALYDKDGDAGTWKPIRDKIEAL